MSTGTEKNRFRAMLPSQFESTANRSMSTSSGLREANATTFRSFSKKVQSGSDACSKEERSDAKVNCSKRGLASCLDETNDMLQNMSMKSKSRSRDAAKTPSALQCRRSESSSLGNTKVQQQPAQNFFSHNEQKSIDSYFSSKLSRSIENLTKSTDMLKLSKSANAPAKTNGLIFKCKCRRFKVGKAESRYPSDVRFFEDRIEYCFVRESQFGKDHIAMVMYYRDMISSKLSMQQGCFVYRVPRQLHHYFQDYEPENQLHVMKVKFERQSDLTAFSARVLPVIKSQSSY